MKKHFWIVLPSLLLFAGCNAPADNTDNATAATPSTPPTTNATKADTGGTQKPAESTNADNAPDPKYRVASEADPRMPAGLIAALEKVQVPPPPAKMTVPKRARVTLSTSKGEIGVELNGEAAPLQVKSFLYLAKRGFYNGTTFHRFADLLEGSGQGTGRIIQGGDPLSKNAATKEYSGMGGPGYQVPREHNSLKHDKFIIAAARSQDPDSAGSQFYFTLDPVSFLDEGEGYTVFGKVVSGQDVVLKLRANDKLNKIQVASLPDTQQ